MVTNFIFYAFEINCEYSNFSGANGINSFYLLYDFSYTIKMTIGNYLNDNENCIQHTYTHARARLK